MGAVKQMESGRAVKEIACKLGVTDQTLYNWKAKENLHSASALVGVARANRAPKLLADGGRRHDDGHL